MASSARNLPPRANGLQGGGMFNPLRGQRSSSMLGGAGFNPLQAGAKSYGLGSGNAPNQGPVRNRAGYAERDIKNQAQQNAFNTIAKGLTRGI